MNKLNIRLFVFVLGLSTILTACKSNPGDDIPGAPSGGGGGGGNRGEAIYFDGTGEHLTMGKVWYTGDFTICFWIKPESITGNTLLSMSANDKYFFLSFNSTEISWHFESDNDTDTQINASRSFSVGNWYHICASGDHGTASSDHAARAVLYVNGVQAGISATAMDAPAAGNAAALTIGADPAPSFQGGSNNKSQPFHGVMDHFMVWSHELSANAIAQLYNGGTGMDPRYAYSNYTTTYVNALQAFHLMGEDPGDLLTGVNAIIIDQVGNNDMTPVNFEAGDFTDGAP